MAFNRDKILQEAQKLVDKKKYDKAIAELQKVVADDPADVRTLLKIGDLYLRLDQHADAISTYERVGNFYSEQGFAVKAVAVYKQIREIVQKHAPHLEDRFGHVVPRLADLLTQLDLRSDALAYYDEMATRLQRIGRERDAIDVFRKIVGLDPQNPVSHLRLADAYTRVRDFDSAVTEYSQAAEILLRIDRKDDALRVVERLMQHRPEGRFARMSAEIYLGRAGPNDAMAALTKLQIAFKENPREISTLDLLARAFDQLGQPSKAIEVQKEAARIAREVQNREEFDRLVGLLVARAPNDEAVRLLAQSSFEAKSMAPQSLGPGGFGGPAVGAGLVAPSIKPTAAPQVQQAQPASAMRPAGSLASTQPLVEPPAQRADSIVDDLSEDVVLEDELEVVSEEEPLPLRSSYPPEDMQGQVRQALGGAEAARRIGEYQRAARILRDGIQTMPLARELRERLCDVLIEAGDQAGAVDEMLAFSRHLVDVDDPDAAARLLDEVLLLEPDNRDALDLLHALGYAVPAVEEQVYDAPASAMPQTAPAAAGYAGEALAPLPSYDLEELTADELPLSQSQEARAAMESAGVLYPPPPPTAPPGPPPAPRGLALDDPFHEATQIGAALPSFPMEDEPMRPSLSGLDEAALEEIEFFQAQGMLDEAEGLLNEQLARLPNHPLLLERRRELLAARGGDTAAAYSTARPQSVPPGSMPPSGAELTGDRAFDIARALDGLDSLDSLEAPMPVAPAAFGQQQVSVEAVFEQFKAGVAAQIAENDAATHYDLGVAYKEMGLVGDAIAEFELASRDPARECVCQSMIGMMHMEQGNLDAAIDAFIRGRTATQKTQEQELALTYEIGNAYEHRENPEQALYYFQLVARIDPSYRDVRGSVAERIATLERSLGHAAPPKPAAKAAAVAAGDEFDAAFDDLFNPKD
ncbi:MAG: tetratricopeptide repeat protein [Polyangiaceae bacterium]|nr:tetratricopeptide repeat protein [Polyangiaceae bacterium]